MHILVYYYVISFYASIYCILPGLYSYIAMSCIHCAPWDSPSILCNEHTIHNLYIIVCKELYYPYYIIHPPLLDCISNYIIPNNIADSCCTEGELQPESCSEDCGTDEDGS